MGTIEEQHAATLARLEQLQVKRREVRDAVAARQRERSERLAAKERVRLLDSSVAVVNEMLASLPTLDLLIEAGRAELAELDQQIKVVRSHAANLNMARQARAAAIAAAERELAEAAERVRQLRGDGS